jgi:hypothetical protein
VRERLAGGREPCAAEAILKVISTMRTMTVLSMVVAGPRRGDVLLPADPAIRRVPRNRPRLGRRRRQQDVA